MVFNFQFIENNPQKKQQIITKSIKNPPDILTKFLEQNERLISLNQRLMVESEELRLEVHKLRQRVGDDVYLLNGSQDSSNNQDRTSLLYSEISTLKNKNLDLELQITKIMEESGNKDKITNMNEDTDSGHQENEEIIDLREKYGVMKDQNIRLMQEINGLKSENMDLTQLINKHESEMYELRTDFKSEKHKNERLLKDTIEAKKMVANIPTKMAVEKFKDEIDLLKKQLEGKEEEIQGLRAALSDKIQPEDKDLTLGEQGINQPKQATQEDEIQEGLVSFKDSESESGEEDWFMLEEDQPIPNSEEAEPSRQKVSSCPIEKENDMLMQNVTKLRAQLEENTKEETQKISESEESPGILEDFRAEVKRRLERLEGYNNDIYEFEAHAQEDLEKLKPWTNSLEGIQPRELTRMINSLKSLNFHSTPIRRDRYTNHEKMDIKLFKTIQDGYKSLIESIDLDIKGCKKDLKRKNRVMRFLMTEMQKQ